MSSLYATHAVGFGSLLLASALLFVTSGTPSQQPLLRARADRMVAHIEKLASFGATPDGGVSRVAFSEEDRRARAWIMDRMRQLGLEVRVDAAANIVGRREGTDPTLPAILFGSHIDTVPQGGKYDGCVGVIGALEAIEVLNEHGIRTRHPLEVVVFTDEEGGLVGSRAMVGDLSPEALEVVSHSGKTIRDGIRYLGGDPEHLERALRKPGEIKAYLELHIEQGGILEQKGIDIGVVEGIVGIRWWDVTIEGFANHAGTTPMDQRRDALVAAARLILAVNRVVTETPGRQVGTVGRITAEPGAPNVIPGRVVMSLELRDLSMAKINQLFDRIRTEADTIARETGTTIFFTPIDVTAVPAPTDPRIRDIIEEQAQRLGLTTLRMPSGAGHDAQDIARIAPVGMIFVPSVGGISHSPKEYTRPEDMAHGASVLLNTLLAIDSGALDKPQSQTTTR